MLKRLVLPDGSVLRAMQAARPCRDSLFTDVLRDGKSLLKVQHRLMLHFHKDPERVLTPPTFYIHIDIIPSSTH